MFKGSSFQVLRAEYENRFDLQHDCQGRRQVKLVLTFRRAIDDLLDSFDSYCACVIANFLDDRHKSRLVEIGL